ETLLDIELVVEILVEDDLGEEAVDGHDGDLAGDLDLVVDDLHVLAGLELVELKPAVGVRKVLGEALLRIVVAGAENFEIGIDAALAFGDVLRERLFEQNPVQPNAGVAAGILLDETLRARRELDAGEPIGFVERR